MFILSQWHVTGAQYGGNGDLPACSSSLGNPHKLSKDSAVRKKSDRRNKPDERATGLQDILFSGPQKMTNKEQCSPGQKSPQIHTKGLPRNMRVLYGHHAFWVGRSQLFSASLERKKANEVLSDACHVLCG